MAGPNTQSSGNPWLAIVPSLGLASVLAVNIDRLWTIAYYENLGLPASGMDFTVTDFAFRSLEALIAVAVAALVAAVAWLQQRRLVQRDPPRLVVEVIAAVAIGVYIRLWLEELPAGLLASTSVLGLFGGAALGAALWLTIDVWFGPGAPGSGKRPRPKRVHWSVLTRLLKQFSFSKPQPGPLIRLAWHMVTFPFALSYYWLMKRIGLGGADPDPRMRFAWRIMAFCMLGWGAFFYFPITSERLAGLEAKADVETGKYAAAILESDVDLPPAIQSSADPMRSAPVRVVLIQKQYTYVLHSTDCTTIGSLDTPASLGGLPPEAPEVCKVVSIPAAHITSVEFFSVNGPRPNQSPLQPDEFILGEGTTAKLFVSEGASDEESLRCSQPKLEGDFGTHFFNSVWYAFRADRDGAVLVRVETDEQLQPSVGVWAAVQEESAAVEPVSGSGETGIACEIRAVAGGDGESGVSDSGDGTSVVGVVANLVAGTRYLVSVGNTNDQPGFGVVSVQFVPDGWYLSPKVEAPLPTVEVPSGQAEVRLGVWELGRADYRLAAPSPAPRFSLLREDGREVAFVTPTPTAVPTPAATPTSTPGPTPTAGPSPTVTSTPLPLPTVPPAIRPFDLYVPQLLTPGRWRLQPPEGFEGLVKLTSVPSEPDVLFSFIPGSFEPDPDPCTQQAIRAEIEGASLALQLGYAGGVGFDPQSELGECGEPAPAIGEPFHLHVQIEGEPEILHLVGDAIGELLRELEFDAIVSLCDDDACIRVFLGADAEP